MKTELRRADSVQTPPALGEAEDLATLRQQYIPSAYLQHHPIYAALGEGAWITDIDGRQYIDFAGGIGVMNVGHRHPRVVEALHRQVDQLLHIGPVTLHENYVRLAARIATKVPGSSNQVLFVNSGAEAVENAVKVARHATGRSAVIAFDGSFHGRTLLTSTLTGKTIPYKTQPGTLAPEIFHAPYPYSYRPPPGVRSESLVEYCLGALENIVSRQVCADKVAAIIIEPVQGEGGYIVPPPGFLVAVQEWCRSIGALLIVDEIQTGYGRTGKFFAFEHEQLEPDITVLGKSLAAGLPLGAIVADAAIFDGVYPGDVGGTYGGNPLSCAAGMAVLDVFDSEPLLERSNEIGRQALSRFNVLAERSGLVGEVRGLGAMLALEFVEDRESRKPAVSLTTRIIERAREEGVIVIKTGSYNNVVRVLIPLVIDDATLDKGLTTLIGAVERELAA